METVALITTTREPWNKGKLVGQKTLFKLKEIWAIRVCLQMARRCRELALFNLAIDSKLRACDLMQFESARRLPRSGHGLSGTRSATKDSSTRSIRNHRAHARRGSGLDHPFSVEARGFSVPKPNTLVTAPVYAAVCQDRRFVGPTTGIGYDKLRYPHAKTNEGDTDLSSNEEREGGTAIARPYQT